MVFTVTPGSTNGMNGQYGVLVAKVVTGSFAESIGITPGSIITEANRVAIKAPNDLIRFANGLRPKSDVVFVVQHSFGGTKTYFGGTVPATFVVASQPLEAYRVRIELARVDPLSVFVVGSSVHFSGTNNVAFAWYGEGPDRGQQLSGEIEFPLQNAELAKRLARAFVHAALLCGGTKSVSPF